MSSRASWSTWIRSLLKGVGVVLAVLSLVSGVRSLTSLWLEHHDAAVASRSSLQAATLLAETDLYELAWNELDRAAAAVSEPELLPYRVDVAMRWVRWLGGESLSQVDYQASAERLLPVLYRAVAEPGDLNPADIKAHIAWAIYLAGLVESTSIDPVALLEEAVAQDGDNLYAHTLLGFFAAEPGRVDYAAVTAHFDAARSPGDEDWALDLQLSAYGSVLADTIQRPDRSHDTVMEVVERVLPVAARRPQNEAFTNEFSAWLWALSNSERVGLAEELVGVLEPDRFLEILDATYAKRGVGTLARYLYARLEEERGNLDAARQYLSRFGDDFAGYAQPAFLALVQSAQARLGVTRAGPGPAQSSGATSSPQTPVARSPGSEPWQTYAATLLDFPIGFLTDEMYEAADFFEAMPPGQVTPEIQAALIQGRNRIKEYVDGGERWLLETGGSESTEEGLRVPRYSMEMLWYLVGRMAEKRGDLDTAITEWTDLYPRLTDFVTLDWELALAHGTRAGQLPETSVRRQQDQTRAVEYLRRHIEYLRMQNEPIPWDEFAAEAAFTSLSDNTDFQALLRGRR